MDPDLVKYAEQAAPRYTSYPTAPHFHSGVDGEAYSGWLGELSQRSSLSLYLHMPYCKQMCWYCGCHAFAARRVEPVDAYVEALLAEIQLVKAATPARRVLEIHWGGGTPNLLSSDQLERVFCNLTDSFDLSCIERHAIEIDPRLIDKQQVRAFQRLGVNRVSIGVQDFDASVQAAIGRVQPYEVVERAVASLREGGIEALSFDLMYGLPHQSIEGVRRTVEAAAAMRPARFSVFGYAHVPWFKTRQKLIDETALPGARLRLDLADAIRQTLANAGYVAIGYDHYALPGDAIAHAAERGALTRNFQGFVEAQCDAIIGLGPSAISTLPQGYAQNEPEVGAWRRAVQEGRAATKRGRAITEEDRVRRDLIMSLLCAFRADLGDFGGVGRFRAELAQLAPLERDGLVSVEQGRLTIPQEARPFARIVAQAFDAYHDTATARHSKAV